MKIDSSFGEQLRMLQGVKSMERPKLGVNEVNKTERADFMDFLKTQVQEVNQQGLEAEALINKSVTGDEANPHTTMLAVQKADISFRLLISIKQRVEQAYQNIMRTQI